MADLLLELIRAQHELLVLGTSRRDRVAAKTATAGHSVINHNGIGYLEGWDTWSDLSKLFSFGVTQPSALLNCLFFAINLVICLMSLQADCPYYR